MKKKIIKKKKRKINLNAIDHNPNHLILRIKKNKKNIQNLDQDLNLKKIKKIQNHSLSILNYMISI